MSVAVTEDWSAGDVEVLARAVVRAPSVHNTQPWRLALPPGRAEVFERPDLALNRHDPDGRDRLISCGAALANLELAVRVLGRRAAITLPGSGTATLAGAVPVDGQEPPSAAELHAYQAISRRRSHRRPFAGARVPDEVADVVASAATRQGVAAALVRDDHLPALAGLFERAARVLRGDREYQAELAEWTAAWRPDGVGDGLLAPAHGLAGPLWADLVPARHRVPDQQTLLTRMEREHLLFFVTAGDERADHVRAGIAMQQAWLAAVDAGLAASVLTQPLHVAPVREQVADRLRLPGMPQLVMRFGRPAEPVARRTPRRPAAEVFHEGHGPPRIGESPPWQRNREMEP
ncbi:Acg family FMN-binding oxidoreductase [Amycolatopsis sp. NPDC059027]|uniref:Acg family FMN-binding oxidoreductase n=1 Tax=Amycolatopsis sp. NPDC059027 TaxID=3346709 RepID=UPI0036714D95